MKFEPRALALSFSIVWGAIYLLCAIFFLVAPNFSLSIANYFFHGFDLSNIVRPVNIGQTGAGLALTIIFSYASAYAFAALYNYLSVEE